MWLGLGIMMQFGVLYVLRVSSLFSLAINLTINPTGPALASKDCHPCPSAPAGIYWRICGTGGFGSWVVEHYLIPGSPEWLSSCAPTSLHQFVGEGRSNIPLPYWQPWPQRKKSQLSQSWHAQIRQVDRMVCVCVSNVFFFEARNWGSIGWFIHFLHHLLLHFLVASEPPGWHRIPICSLVFHLAGWTPSQACQVAAAASSPINICWSICPTGLASNRAPYCGIRNRIIHHVMMQPTPEL